jgi:hypothetical protein
VSLLGNYSVLHKSPAKYLTGTVGFGDRSNFNKPGMMRSRGNSPLWQYDALPSGFYAGRAYFPPVKAGRLVSRNIIKVQAVASGASGLPASASATLAINSFAFGGLIAGGVASCTFSVNAVASIAGLAAGRASSLLRLNLAAVAGASAFGVASSVVRVNAFARPYGLGYMKASTVDNTTLTAKSISAEVWAAIAANNNAAGTMGQKLNSSASGGVDYAALGEAVWQHATRTLTSGSTAPTAAEVTAAVIAALNATNIPVDVHKIKGLQVNGTGTEADPWGP